MVEAPIKSAIFISKVALSSDNSDPRRHLYLLGIKGIISRSGDALQVHSNDEPFQFQPAFSNHAFENAG
jgi:hypothetical protein